MCIRDRSDMTIGINAALEARSGCDKDRGDGGVIFPLEGRQAVTMMYTMCLLYTSFATNMVLCIIMMPFMVTFATSVGMNPTGAVALLFFSCQMSLATPGGGAPVSAIFYDVTDYIKVGQMGKYAVIAIIFLFLGDVILGLTWASIIF